MSVFEYDRGKKGTYREAMASTLTRISASRDTFPKRYFSDAKERKLVIVCPESDGHIRFRGAAHYTIRGDHVFFNSDGILQDCDLAQHGCDAGTGMVHQYIDSNGHTVRYNTNIPHSIFTIWDKADTRNVYCLGIVFSLDDLPVVNENKSIDYRDIYRIEKENADNMNQHFRWNTCGRCSISGYSESTPCEFFVKAEVKAKAVRFCSGHQVQLEFDTSIASCFLVRDGN